MRLRGSVAGLACVVALFGAACGGGSEQTDLEDTPADEGGGGAIEVVAENFAFSPTSIPVEAGSEIELTFTNNDDTQHSFTAESAGVDLVVDGGASDSATFTAPDSGSIDFVCKFHASMTGTISTDGSGAGGAGSDDSQDLDY
jgi:plastocyanin